MNSSEHRDFSRALQLVWRAVMVMRAFSVLVSSGAGLIMQDQLDVVGNLGELLAAPGSPPAAAPCRQPPPRVTPRCPRLACSPLARPPAPRMNDSSAPVPAHLPPVGPGSGSFGEVYLARWKKGSTQLVNNVKEPRSGQARAAPALFARSLLPRAVLRRSSPPLRRPPAPPPLAQLAVKVLRDTSLSDPKAVQDFKTEASPTPSRFLPAPRRRQPTPPVSPPKQPTPAHPPHRSRSSASSATRTSSTTRGSAPGPTTAPSASSSSSPSRR